MSRKSEMKAAKKARLQAESRERKILIAFYGETDYVESESTVADICDVSGTIQECFAGNSRHERALIGDLVSVIGNALDNPAFAASCLTIEDILGTDEATDLVLATREYFSLTETFSLIRDGRAPMQGDLAVVFSAFRSIGPAGESGYVTRVAAVMPRSKYSDVSARAAVAMSMSLFGARDNYARDSAAHLFMHSRTAA